jgi:hypothetical protein
VPGGHVRGRRRPAGLRGGAGSAPGDPCTERTEEGRGAAPSRGGTASAAPSYRPISRPTRGDHVRRTLSRALPTSSSHGTATARTVSTVSGPAGAAGAAPVGGSVGGSAHGSGSGSKDVSEDVSEGRAPAVGRGGPRRASAVSAQARMVSICSLRTSPGSCRRTSPGSCRRTSAGSCRRASTGRRRRTSTGSRRRCAVSASASASAVRADGPGPGTSVMAPGDGGRRPVTTAPRRRPRSRMSSALRQARVGVSGRIPRWTP